MSGKRKEGEGNRGKKRERGKKRVMVGVEVLDCGEITISHLSFYKSVAS